MLDDLVFSLSFRLEDDDFWSLEDGRAGSTFLYIWIIVVSIYLEFINDFLQSNFFWYLKLKFEVYYRRGVPESDSRRSILCLHLNPTWMWLHEIHFVCLHLNPTWMWLYEIHSVSLHQNPTWMWLHEIHSVSLHLNPLQNLWWTLPSPLFPPPNNRIVRHIKKGNNVIVCLS